MKKTNLRVLAIVVGSLLFLLSNVFAFQDEGTRVKFQRGSSSTILKGTVAKGGPDFYLINAKAGQTMIVKAMGKVSFGIDSPNGALTSDDSKTNWSGELPADGDYKIRVYSSGGVQSYSLKVSIISGSANKSSPASTAEASPCLGEQLSLREVEGESDMGGKRYGNYVFTNRSTTTCTLAGFPKFALLNRNGQILRNVKVEYSNNFTVSGDTDGNQSSEASKIVTLTPGKSAWFQIFYNDGMAIDHKRPFPISAKVRVTAPHTERAFLIKSEIQACCGVEVSAVRSGMPQ